MTLIPPGAHLAPVDLPPPRPEDDPREPSPAVSSRRGTRTPSRAHHSPSASRAASPTRGGEPRPSSIVLDGSGPTLLQPIPKHPTSPPMQSHTSSASPHMPHPHHHSRPASPAASIHSSTSAIFERDIELPAVASLSLNPNPAQPHTLHHKSSRLSHLSHGSALDHTVPAVLDDAVEALSARSQGNLDGLEIEAPAAGMGVSMARQSSASLHQIGSSPRKTSSGPGGVGLPLVGGSGTFHSRSPSPISVASRASSSVASPAHSPPIMGQLSAQQLQQMALPPPMKTGSTSPTASVPRPPMPGRVSTGPQLPGAWSGSFSAQNTSEKLVDGSPMSQSTPLARENTSPIAEEMPSPGLPPTPPNAIPPHLTPSKDKRRISFISYNDLLLSVPTSITPLGEITSGNLSPDHLPGTVSPSMTNRSPILPPPMPSLGPISGSSAGPGALESKPSWETGRTGGLGLEGEWEREGLGKGLEQRLEGLAGQQQGR